MIGQLLDDILIAIISRLSISEAAQTSVLSRRWENLWKFFSGSLKFNDIKLYYDNETSKWKRPCKIKRNKYIKLINRVLESLHGRILDHLELNCLLNKSNTTDINRLIEFAMEKSVFRLTLNFLKCSAIPRQLYTFSSNSLCFSRFSSLKELCLHNMNISGEVFECLLRDCKVLERLCVTQINGLVNLKVSGPTLPLKYLKLSDCLPLEDLEIDAINLTSFHYIGSGEKRTIYFKNVPALIDLSLDGPCFKSLYVKCHHHSISMSQHSISLSQLETLSLECRVIEGIGTGFKEIPELINLKKFNLTVYGLDSSRSLIGFTSLLVASPLLQRFKLEFQWTIKNKYDTEMILKKLAEIRKKWNTLKFQHQCLKELELNNFVGRENEVELVSYLVKIAVSLEKVKINFHRDVKKKYVRKLMGSILRPGIKLVIS